MFAQVAKLEYWKSEHDETTCEDACSYDSLRGLFALSDGAGTTLFSNIWAQVLVDQFVSLPLFSDDPFEVEWWLRQAQEIYKTKIASIGQLPWNVQQKAQNQGSYATLATLRIAESKSAFAKAELLSIGDSCAFIDNHSDPVRSFPLTQDSDFERSPICFPSKLGLFNRYFQRCLSLHIDITPGDTLVLASDAVARWIVSAGNGRYATSHEALHEVMIQTPLTWKDFILTCRTRREIVDDDCTALVISFSSQPQQRGSYFLLGTTTRYDKMVRTQRKIALEQAILAQNKELVAIIYGDGKALNLEGISLSLSEIQQARLVADALREVLSALRESLNIPDGPTLLRPVWQKNAPLLATEPCAAHLRQTLTKLGIPLEYLPVQSQAQLQSSRPPEPPVQAVQHNGEVPITNSTPGLSEPLIATNAVPQGNMPAEQNVAQPLPRAKQTPEALQAFSTQKNDIALQDTLSIEVVHLNDLQQLIRKTITQGHIQPMAHAYELLQKTAVILPEDDMKRLALAYSFHVASKHGNDDQRITAFEDILHSPYHGFFVFSPEEEAQVSQAWQLKMNQTIPPSSPQEASSSTISDAWFRKVCMMKELYLAYKQLMPIPRDRIENSVIEDLTDDPYIQEAIEEVNTAFARKTLNPDTSIEDEFRAFVVSPSFNYETIRVTYPISDEEAKAVLGIFLRAEILAHYLEKRQIKLYDWLARRKSEGKTSYSLLAEAEKTRRPKLLWWRR